MYKDIKIKTDKELFKVGEQDQKDLVTLEFCLSNILLNALQLTLHIVYLQSEVSTKPLKSTNLHLLKADPDAIEDES